MLTWVYDRTFEASGGTFRVPKEMYKLSERIQQENARALEKVQNNRRNKMSEFLQQDWNTFREAGLLFLINQLLHFFGWAIVVEIDEDGKSVAYPARVKYRGFCQDSIEKGYKKIAKYMVDNATELEKEANT